MTIREYLHQKMGHFRKVRLFGFVIFLVGSGLAFGSNGQNPIFAGVAIAGFIACVVGGIFAQAKVCCPKCGKGVGKFLVRDDDILFVWRPIDYCPYCGVSLDSELTDF